MKKKIIDYFFDEDEVEIKKDYKLLGIVLIISMTISLIAIIS